MRAEGSQDERDVTFLLAGKRGVCRGVRRALDLARETRRRHPDRRILLVGELVHNPGVNRDLREAGIEIAPDPWAGGAPPGPDDVVILPAFGVPLPLLARLEKAGSLRVDATCGSVTAVFRRVERHVREGRTVLLHGKPGHPEARAAVSRVRPEEGGRYVIVRDRGEAEVLGDAIRGRLSREEFGRRFAGACSPGLDPHRDLGRIGMANQTTMAARESLAVQSLVRAALADRYGAEEAESRLAVFDTICRATQERQDALREILREPVDLVLVVGGHSSSNTANLARIASERVSAYHVEDAGGILSAEEIRHRVPSGEIRITRGWLPPGPVTIGVTAGASTPEGDVREVMDRIRTLARAR